MPRLCFVAVGTLFGLALALLLGGAVLLAFGDTLAQYVGLPLACAGWFGVLFMAAPLRCRWRTLRRGEE